MRKVLALGLVAAFACDRASSRVEQAAQAPTFSDYPADSFAGPIADVDVRTPDLFSVETVVRAGAAAGPNFAGYLTIVTWSCGTQCRSHVIVDTRTGSVHADSTLDFSCHAPEFHRTSRLVIQRADTATFGPCSGSRTQYFEWLHGSFAEVAPGAI